jgi:hypothetical protein
MYSSDNDGWLVASYPGSSAVNRNADCWVQGDMTLAGEASNTELLRAGKLYPYMQSVKVYQCPSASEVTTQTGKRVTGVRSFSMNSFMGARDPSLGFIPATAFRHVPYFSKEAEIPQPSRLWVIVEEDERSINDGFFVTDPEARVWIDFPPISTRRHGMGYDLTFADGHSESWKLRDPKTEKVRKHKTEQASNQDLDRLAKAATVLK